MLMALALDSTKVGMSGGRWKESLSLFQTSLYFHCHKGTKKQERELLIREDTTHTAPSPHAAAHVADVVGVLLGQHDRREVDHAGELQGARGLAVQPLVDDGLSVSGFDDVHGVLGRPAVASQPLHVGSVHGLENRKQVKPQRLCSVVSRRHTRETSRDSDQKDFHQVYIVKVSQKDTENHPLSF